MRFEEAKHEAARFFGYGSWQIADYRLTRDGLDNLYKKAAELYAESLQKEIAADLKAEIERLKSERFEMPNEKTLIDFAILFNEGKLDPEQLANMVGMCQMILDRLHDHGNVKHKSKQEIIDEQNQTLNFPL